MTAVDIGCIPALNLGASGAAPGIGGTLPDCACGSSAAQAATASANGGPGSFQRFLRDAGKPLAQDDSISAPEGQPSEIDYRPMNRLPAADSALDAFMQLIQSMMMGADRFSEPVNAPSEERPEADICEDGEGFLRFIDLLKQLQTLQGAPEDESGDPLVRIRDLLNRLSTDSEGQKASGLPGRLHQLLTQLRETVPEVPWGRLAQLITGQGDSTGRPAEPQHSGRMSLTPAGDAAPDAAGRPDLPGLLGETLKQGKTKAAEIADPPGRPEASKAFPSASRAAEPVSEPAALQDRPRSPSAPAADSTRESSPATERVAAKAQEMPPPADGSRQPVPESSAPLTIAIEDGGGDSLSAAILRAGRTAPPSENAADKAATAGAAPKPPDAERAAVKGDVVEQIVQRAAVHLKNDQGMARIDLKPEFLGQVRMQIVTDSQQVTVRIITELPMVRDLIEQNLHQLKSDLQQQGLQVERVEVSVGDDPRRDTGRQGRAGRRRSGRGASEVDVPSVGVLEQEARNLSAYWSPGGRTTINTFV